MNTHEAFSCTDIAWEYGLPLVGTATRSDIWFLIEYPGRWEPRAFEQSEIPAEVKTHIQAAVEQGSRVRTLLIRQDGSRERASIQFFIGLTHPLAPRLYQYHLEDYHHILDVDLASFAAGEPGDPAHLRAEPLYLVCTNGRRDRCCAVYGPEIYQHLTEEAGQAVWQSSHIGGHNQAPISLFFPHGINYAHTTPSEARRLVRAYRRNEVVLHHLRGRVGLDPHIQAAEHFWREQTGVLVLPGMRVEAVSAAGPDTWAVTISAVDGDKSICIRLQRRESDFKIPITCSQAKESPIISFHRLD